MNIMYEFAALLVGGGLFAFIQFLINRHDSRFDRSIEIIHAIDSLSVYKYRRHGNHLKKRTSS